MDRKAKIVATIGPSSNNEKTLTQLILAGLDVARLNFSHGTHEDHGRVIALIRRLSDDLSKPITILQDLQGPKLSVGKLPAEGIELLVNQIIILQPVDETGSAADIVSGGDILHIPMDVPDLVNSVKTGNRVLLDDGIMELVVVEVGSSYLKAKVVLGGILKSHKGVNLPGANLDIPPFTEKDRQDLEFGLQQNIDVVAISFVRTGEEILKVRQIIADIDPAKKKTPIIAKLERPEAIDNLEDILSASDGVMVARGDLAVETSPYTVPIMQKKIIEAANQHEKTVITATQMLDSMIHNPRPTRAEASDVANAVFDGSDAVMLSGESASGEYPVESVAMMAKIVQEAETHFSDWGKCKDRNDVSTFDDAVSITRAARELAHDREVRAIAVFTETGRTALLMSKARPAVPIYAFTPIIATYRRMGLYWGVTPMLVPFSSTIESMLSFIDNAIISFTDINIGEQVIMISGFPVGAMRPPNFALLHTIGEPV